MNWTSIDCTPHAVCTIFSVYDSIRPPTPDDDSTNNGTFVISPESNRDKIVEIPVYVPYNNRVVIVGVIGHTRRWRPFLL